MHNNAIIAHELITVKVYKEMLQRKEWKSVSLMSWWIVVVQVNQWWLAMEGGVVCLFWVAFIVHVILWRRRRHRWLQDGVWKRLHGRVTKHLAQWQRVPTLFHEGLWSYPTTSDGGQYWVLSRKSGKWWRVLVVAVHHEDVSAVLFFHRFVAAIVKVGAVIRWRSFKK